jgi:predicted HicB family RNase H-like nuclease
VKRRGRPKLSAAKKLVPVAVCMMPSEVKAARRAAKAEGVSFSAWVRRKLAEALGAKDWA